MIYEIVKVVITILIGAISMFFVMRNNPKYLKVDKLLKEKRNAIIKHAKEKGIKVSNELKKAIDEVLK